MEPLSNRNCASNRGIFGIDSTSLNSLKIRDKCSKFTAGAGFLRNNAAVLGGHDKMDILYNVVTVSASIYNCTYSWVVRQEHVVRYIQYRYFKNVDHRLRKICSTSKHKW